MTLSEMHAIYEFLTEHPDTKFTTKELSAALGIKVTTQAINYSGLTFFIKEKKERAYSFWIPKTSVKKNERYVFPAEPFTVIGVEKRRERLYFTNDAELDEKIKKILDNETTE